MNCHALDCRLYSISFSCSSAAINQPTFLADEILKHLQHKAAQETRVDANLLQVLIRHA